MLEACARRPPVTVFDRKIMVRPISSPAARSEVGLASEPTTAVVVVPPVQVPETIVPTDCASCAADVATPLIWVTLVCIGNVIGLPLASITSVLTRAPAPMPVKLTGCDVPTLPLIVVTPLVVRLFTAEVL